MAKVPTDIRSLARVHTRTAIATLAGIMRQKTAPPMARIAAARVLLEHGWGKATTPLRGSGGDEPPRRQITEIIRTIVDPKEVPEPAAAAGPAAVTRDPTWRVAGPDAVLQHGSTGPVVTATARWLQGVSALTRAAGGFGPPASVPP